MAKTSSLSIRKIYIKLLGQSLLAGEVHNEKLFVKEVESKTHLFKNLEGYGIDGRVVNSLLKDGIDTIEIREKDTDSVYQVSTRRFKEQGHERKYGNHGFQYILPLSKFKKLK